NTGVVKALEVVMNASSRYAAVKHGLAMIPEERSRAGIVVGEDVAKNLAITHLNPFTHGKTWLSKVEERAAAVQRVEKLRITTPNEKTLVSNLSGGNQQKIAIGEWLLTDADIYIFDEPTKGVDVGAKKDVYTVIAALAEQGKCIIFASSEIDEMIGLTDR